jgi:hypothetical protein
MAVPLMALAVLSACGGSHETQARPRTSVPVTAVRVDTWKPPVVRGPPSTEKFCTLLVADYTHLKTNVIAANMKIRQQIIGDYIRYTPTVIAAAPPTITVAATLYLSSIAEVLSILNSVGLNAARAPPGQIGTVLTDPAVQAASTQVLGFSQQYCHYNIAGGV